MAEALYGIPVSIYRPGMHDCFFSHVIGAICGAFSTGGSNYVSIWGECIMTWKESYFHKLICSMVELHSYPDVTVPLDWAPVDYVARCLVFISRNPIIGEDRVFHLNSHSGVASGSIHTLAASIRRLSFAN